MRVGGFEIPDNERLEIALTRIYGIGRKNVAQLLGKANLDPNQRAGTLTPTQVARLVAALEGFKVGGELRRQVEQNIARLKAIRCYRGLRHILNLPVRGQRTRTNARTKRGPRKTVGALTKEMWAKLEAQQRAALAKQRGGGG